jgi:predicted RNase H-like HicB family nuclease
MSQNYRTIVTYSEAKQAFVAEVPELPSCEAAGATRAEALAKLEEEMQAQLENMQAQGVELPRPIDELEFDGSLAVKVTPALHRELAFIAKADSVELEVLLTELLTRGAKERWGGYRGGPRREGGRPRREEGGARYHNIMDNRENFIEYVRSLDTPGGNRGPVGPGGGRRGGRR